uniref:Uncharacterized protein n=1 Tax=Candidatus Kentrum sp. MB TaxID=2138164 RepID=A0A451B869_9GAMM|nr:MAG: hypothetical protein BECKMB1821G_GA0114241_100543 [Candidatus Kentron sp. MB]VFK27952.1 MAG: hypothetical protein BECKMB1821I_GA0114274_100541 [Candidatus Kentron sp. MB]VFK74476.1 MAG: hypothetical protein BECKMB1821H_GA0114242_100541 [Candidatus Kentron sp. MB]
MIQGIASLFISRSSSQMSPVPDIDGNFESSKTTFCRFKAKPLRDFKKHRKLLPVYYYESSLSERETNHLAETGLKKSSMANTQKAKVI